MPHVISSVKALIQNEDKFLFLKESLHHSDVWDLPGGKIEYGEEPTQALLREVKEETCLDVKILKPVGLWWFFSTENKHQVICHTFLCQPVGKIEIDFSKNPADEHHTEYRWLTIEEVLASQEVKVHDSLIKLLSELQSA